MAIVKKGLLEIEGKTFDFNKYVIANKNSDYCGLKGVIQEVRTGKDKETENETDDIVVSFEMPTDYKLISKLESHFSSLYGEKKSIEDIGIDMVICSYDEIDLE